MNLKEILFLGLVASIYNMCGAGEGTPIEVSAAITASDTGVYVPTAYLAPRESDAVLSGVHPRLQIPSI